MNTMSDTKDVAPVHRTKNRLPRGVWNIALTELWERYSFYGLLGILSFYMLYSLDKGGLNLAPATAASIVGAYGGAVYLAQILGAWLGDRLVAPKHMVFYGALVITIGHLVLAFSQGVSGLGAGLVLIILGTGSLKTNITSIVGFIVEGEPQQVRDVSFSYFYLAINVGAVLGPLTTGFLQNRFGFHFGFGLAAIGMLAALIQYLVSMKLLPARAASINNPLPRKCIPLVVGTAVAGPALVVFTSMTGLLRVENLASTTTVLSLIAATGYFLTLCNSKTVTPDERRRVLGYLPLFLSAGIYFGLLFQKFTAISILVKERVDLQVGDWTFPVAWITTVSPLALVFVIPFIARLWEKRGDRQPSPITKYSVGLIQIGVAYFFLLAISQASGDALIPLALVLMFMVIAGSSEAFIGPIGLSLATKIGPAAFRSQMVGLNFLTLALGSSISGLLGQLFTLIATPVYFLFVGSTGVLIGLVLLLFRRPLNRLITAGE